MIHYLCEADLASADPGLLLSVIELPEVRVLVPLDVISSSGFAAGEPSHPLVAHIERPHGVSPARLTAAPTLPKWFKGICIIECSMNVQSRY